MNRYTKRDNLKNYEIEQANLKLAINKLGKLEDMIESIETEQVELSKELEILRKQGLTKSIHFREKMSIKLANCRMTMMLEKYEIK